jgi:toxin-antitoxin system PIN domain toxin
MTIVDGSVLLNAVNSAGDLHQRARDWLETALAGTETVGFPWVTILAFLRIATNARVLPEPLRVADARERLQEWLAVPVATIVEPGPGHLQRLTDLLDEAGTAGNLVTDAHIAAIAMDYDAEVVTFDRDFGRFEGLRWRIP